MTLDDIYNDFICSIHSYNPDILLQMENLVQNFQICSYQQQDSLLISQSLKLSRTYHNGLPYWNHTDIDDHFMQALFCIHYQDEPILDKIEKIRGIFAFYSRRDNNISCYEKRKNASYDINSYIVYGEFLKNILDPFYDWVVPIISSKLIEETIENLSLEQSLFYLKYLYYHFYRLFFPYHNQNLELMDIFSEIDMFREDILSLSDTTISFLYQNIREVQAKIFIKNKIIC